MPLISKQVLKERREKIQQLRDQGLTPSQIAEKMGLGLRAVQRALRGAGLSNPTGRPAKLLDTDLNKLYRLTKQRVRSLDELASLYKVSISTLRRRLRDYELTLSTEERLTVIRTRDRADADTESGG